MTLNILSYVLVANVVIIYGLRLDNCDSGPQYWCRNTDTATECDAVEICETLRAVNTANADKVGDANRTNEAAPVEVTLFFESLCPGCRKFIQRQLYPAFLRLHTTGILKVKLYSYGNAHEHWNGARWTFRCQHGTKECELNRLETCAFHQLNDGQQVPFLHCVESNPRVSTAKKCLQEVGGDWVAVMKCYSDGEGHNMQHEVAKIQKALHPRLNYVPWILVNGYHDNRMQSSVMRNMVSHVCNAYTGTKPAQCYQASDEN